MPSPATTADLIGLIRKSGLIDEERLTNVAFGLPQEPAACADALIEAGLLTPFQAKQLLTGRACGLVLGPYRVLRPLGKGGMGVVYLAEHADLQRKVALKVLSEEQSGEELALERFFREARAAAALDHPNIVRLHDVAQSNGTHYLVMEYVDGTDLEALIEQTGSLHASQAAGYISQAATGLQHAHDRGIIHRDIKPANLMVGKNGIVKVLDMGLARSVSNPKDALTGRIEEDVITGTADFLSPEQALNVRLDTRTDIYSLGCTFYTLLTGRPPFEGSTAQKLAQHQMAAPPDVRASRFDVPPQMAAVIARMMAKKPEDRYQTAREVIAALAPWVPTADIATRETVGVEPGAPTIEMRQHSTAPASATRAPRAIRWQRVALTAGCGAVVLAAGILSTVLGRSKPLPEHAGDERPPEPTPPPAPATPAPLPVPAAAKDFRWLIGHTANVNDVVVSPDEARLASVDWSGKLIIWDLRTGQRLHDLPTRRGARALACTTTPDGQLVLVAGERMPILAFEWATGREVREYPAHEQATWGLAVSPSGELLASCGADGLVLLRKLASGEEVLRLEFAAKLVWSVAFSADGKMLAATCGTGPTAEESYLVRVWSTADGKQLHQFSGQTWDVRTCAFRPDGGAIAAGSFDGTVRLWSLTTGEELRNFVAHDGVLERVFFLPGGRLLTCGGPMQHAKSAWEGGAVKVWDTETGRELKVWKGEGWSELISLAPFGRGQLAAAGGRDRNVRVWSLSDSPPVDKLIHTFTLSLGEAFRSRYENKQHSDFAPFEMAGQGIYMHCWKKESVAEFRGEPDGGRPWIGISNLNVEISSQILFQFDEARSVPLSPGKRYRVRLEYRTTGEAEGHLSVRNPKGGDYPSVAEMPLDRTDGKWKSLAIAFRRPPDGQVDVCIMSTGVGEGNLLAVRGVGVFEAAEDDK